MSRPWTLSCVACLHVMSVAKASLEQMAFTLARTESEIDLALWALAGRSIPAALAALNRPAAVAQGAVH